MVSGSIWFANAKTKDTLLFAINQNLVKLKHVFFYIYNVRNVILITFVKNIKKFFKYVKFYKIIATCKTLLMCLLNNNK